TGHRADLGLLVRLAVAELSHAGEIAEVVGGDDHALDLLLEDLPQSLARQPGDLPFERAHARLAGVVANEVAQALFRQFEFALLEAVGLYLLFDQVALG